MTADTETRKLDNDTAMAVANTIRAQLGGGPAFYMIGASNILALSDNFGGIQFKIGRNAHRVTHVRIELNASDTYDVSFHRVTRRGLECKELARFDGVYVDSLRELFEKQTGLYLSL